MGIRCPITTDLTVTFGENQTRTFTIESLGVTPLDGGFQWTYRVYLDEGESPSHLTVQLCEGAQASFEAAQEMFGMNACGGIPENIITFCGLAEELEECPEGSPCSGQTITGLKWDINEDQVAELENDYFDVFFVLTDEFLEGPVCVSVKKGGVGEPGSLNCGLICGPVCL